MNSQPPPTLRAIWILVGLGLGRFWNKLTPQLRSRHKKRGARTGTPKKRNGMGLLLVLVSPLLLLQATFMSSNLANRITRFANAELDTFEHLRVDWSTYYNLKLAQERIGKMNPNPFETDEIPIGLETALTKLRETLEREADQAEEPAVSTKPGVQQIIDHFSLHGLRGFADPAPSIGLWPDTGHRVKPAGLGLFLRTFALIYLFLFVALTVIGLAAKNQDLGRVQWSFVWLFTFPVSARTLFTAKLCEYLVTNAMLWFLVAPLTAVLLASTGWGWGSIPLAIPLAAVFGVLLAAVQIMLETWLRMVLPLSKLKNIQAACTVFGILALYALLTIALGDSLPAWFVSVARATPDMILYLPTSLPVLVNPWTPHDLARIISLCTAVALPLLCIGIAASLVGRGVVGSNTVHLGERGLNLVRVQGGKLFGGILRKEIHLLLRDRNFLVQTVLVPFLIIGIQMIIHPKMLDAAAEDFRHATMLAYGISAYVLLTSSMTLITGEGRGLWLLYTLPESLESILRRKVKLWIVVAFAYATIILLVVGNPDWSWDHLAHAAMAFVGLWIFGYIAGGLAVISADPLDEEAQRRPKPGTVYLQMFLASTFAYAIYSPSWWHKITLIILMAAVGIAIWEIVRDRLPFLLDPTAAPLPRIRLSHGLIASLAFFVLQGITVLIMLMIDQEIGPAELTIAYGIAGSVVVVATLLSFMGIDDIKTSLGLRRDLDSPPTQHAIFVGLGMGIAAAVIGAIYLGFVHDSDWFIEISQARQMPGIGQTSDQLWMTILLVVAAPLCEEFIFRALVFRGLRARFSFLPAALISAALFMIVHPPISWLPVFGLGIATAVAFEYGGLLIAPILVHAIYNAVILLIQA